MPNRRLDTVITVLLFVGLLLFYLAVQRGSTPTYDASIYVDVAANLADHGSVEVRHDTMGFNTPYSFYGLGLSLVLVPFYLLQRTFQPGGQEILLLVNPCFIAATAALIYRIGSYLRWSRGQSVSGSVIFGLLSMAVQQSTDIFSEPGVGFFIVVSLLGLLGWRSGTATSAWLVGVGVGGTIFFRADSMVLCGVLVPLVIAFVSHRRLLDDWRWLYRLGVPLGAAFAYQLAYNRLRFGSVFSMGYDGIAWSTPLLEGLYGNTLSPGKGLFVFNAMLILALPGLVILWRRDRPVALVVVVLSIARIFFYAKWSFWYAGVGWGPRFMFPLCGVLTIPTVEAIRHVGRLSNPRRSVARVGVATLMMLALGTSALSVLVPFERWWRVANAAEGVAGSPPVASAEQIADNVHGYFWTFPRNHIAGNLRLVDDTSPPNLRWFHSDRSPWGALLLASGLALLAAARWLARVSRVTGARPVRARPPVTTGVDQPSVAPSLQ